MLPGHAQDAHYQVDETVNKLTGAIIHIRVHLVCPSYINVTRLQVPSQILRGSQMRYSD